jgi:carbon monoxide dehydrogenase subunit G
MEEEEEVPMIEGQIYIARPPGVVFDFVADERNECRFNPKMLEVTLVSDEPPRAGSRFQATIRSGARKADMTIDYTEFVRPTRLASVTRLRSMDIYGSLSFEPEGNGTRMSWSWEIRLRGALRPVRPIVEWLGRRQEPEIWGRLKAVLEASETPSWPAAGSWST